MRTASCPLACMVSSTRRAIRCGRNRTAPTAMASAIAEKAISRMALSTSLSVARKTDRMMMGPTSPIVPTARTTVPKAVAWRSASRRIGTSTPSAVVARAMPTNSGSETTPAASSPNPIATPSTSPINHPAPASRAGAPAILRRSISRPARKKSAASPRLERKSTNSSGSAMSSTWGPITMPSRISTTTVAMRARRGMSAMIGASTATPAMITSVERSGCTAADSQRADCAAMPAWNSPARGGLRSVAGGPRGFPIAPSG